MINLSKADNERAARVLRLFDFYREGLRNRLPNRHESVIEAAASLTVAHLGAGEPLEAVIGVELPGAGSSFVPNLSVSRHALTAGETEAAAGLEAALLADDIVRAPEKPVTLSDIVHSKPD